MAHVIVLDSLNEDIFVCGFCKTVYNSLQMFLDHKRSECSHNGLEQKSPDPVSNVQPVASGSNDGVRLNQNSNPLPIIVNEERMWPELMCSVCKKKYKKMKTLLAHMKTHNEKPYQCLLCGRCFIQNSHLQRHILSHKVWPDGRNETTAKTPEAELLSYSCAYCELILCNYSQYKTHLKNHLHLKRYKCIQGECMEYHDSIDNLLHHVSLTHTRLEFHCHICNATFHTLEQVALHQQSHNNPDSQVAQVKQYKCPQCDASFRKLDKLSLHMLVDNHKKICIHCNKIFASDKRLRLHLQIHRQQKPYQCNICNSSFHMKKYLTSHMLKHGNSQFKCPICKSMFKRQDLLQRHMRLHQPKKMIKCPFRETLDCKKEFSRSDKLKSHLKCHTKHVSIKTKSKARSTKSQKNGSVKLPLTI